MAEPLRVLFVEDSEDDLALLLRELRQGGYDPVYQRVETEPALRAALEAEPWDLILSDFAMPRFDGIAAYEIVRQQAPLTPFLFVSGHIGEERAVDAMRRGVKDYVLKDNLRRLVPAIRRELEEARQRSAGQRAEEQLQASQRLLKTVFDAIPHFLVVKDLESRYLMVNKAWAEAYAVPAESVVGRRPADVITRPEEEAERYGAQDLEVMRGAGATLKAESAFTLANGEQRLLEAIKTPLRDEQGRIVGMVGVLVDRTAERTAEQRADVALTRLSDAIESLHSGFMLFDKDERLLLWNRYMGHVLPGMYPMLRQGVTFEGMLRQAAQDTVSPNIEGWIAGRLANFRANPGRFEQQMKGGRWIEGFDQRTSDGGTVSLRFDVTEQKLREQELRQAQKMEAVGQLTGGVAHDFNNILTVILACSEFVVAKLPEDDPALLDILMIQDAGRSAAALTRQLLAFSRRQVLHMQTVNLNHLAAGMHQMLQRLIGEHIEVALNRRADPGDLRADPSQLEQVILNLAVNARDAMPNGGVLTIETENQVLDAAYAAAHLEVTPGAYVMLSVSDTGTGMNEETKRQIFDPFFTTKPSGQGTGLGLATVYGIVKQMNGSVFVYSEVGKGTTFKLYFPAPAAAPAAAPAPTPAAPEKRPTETVLLVEDDDLVRRSAERMLTTAGYTVLTADGPEQAMQVVTRHTGPLHLLLSDVVMRGGTGPEMWARLKTRRLSVSGGSGELTPLPALFMSGYTGDAATRQGLVDGDLPFLAKPFSSEELLQKVRDVLDGGR